MLTNPRSEKLYKNWVTDILFPEFVPRRIPGIEMSVTDLLSFLLSRAFPNDILEGNDSISEGPSGLFEFGPEAFADGVA